MPKKMSWDDLTERGKYARRRRENLTPEQDAKDREARRRWYYRNLDYERARRRKKYVDNKEREDKLNKLWREAHPERARQLRREHHQKNREHNLTINRLWMQANLSRFRLIHKTAFHARRARIAKTGGRHSTAEWIALVKATGNRCLSCWKAGNPATLHRDHIVSVFHGGSNDIENIQPLCPPCNHTKHRNSIDYHLDRFAPMFRDNPEWLTASFGDEL